MDAPKPRRRWLALAALAIGIAIVVLDGFLTSRLTGWPMRFEWEVEPFVALIVAAPFLILAARRTSAVLPWLVGLALTLAFWGYVLDRVVNNDWVPDGTGADIGLGLIVLVIAPIVVSTACIAADLLVRRFVSKAN